MPSDRSGDFPPRILEPKATWIDPRKILWGDIDRKALPADEVAEARETIMSCLPAYVAHVTYDGANFWLATEPVSLAAALSCKPKIKSIPVFVHEGGKDEADQISRLRKLEGEELFEVEAEIEAAEAAARIASAPLSFSDQLRAIIQRDGRTIYAIETTAGVPRGGVGRFLSGERGLTTDTLDRLAGVLGLRVVGRDEDEDQDENEA